MLRNVSPLRETEIIAAQKNLQSWKDNQSRFLVIAKEALGLTFNETLDSSYGLIEILLQEYSFVMRERNKTADKDGEVEGKDYEWVELPNFDNPDEKIRMKKYNDIGGKVRG